MTAGTASDPPVQAALDAVERAEEAALAPRDVATFEVAGRVARNVDTVPDLELSRLAHSLARRRVSETPTERIRARSGSAVIVLGKYARATQVKARAYLGDDGPLTLKVWTHTEGELPLGRRERDVRARVQSIADYRAPEVLSSGAVDDTDYLLERIVYGRHPRTPGERFAAAEDLLGSLSRAYLRHGVEDRPLTEVVHSSFPERIKGVLTDPDLPWSPEWGSRRRLARRLARLVNRDLAMSCSLGHGDLVATNIIRDRRKRHVLIDWEHGRFMPVAFDLSKLLATSGDPRRLESRMGHALKPFSGHGRRHYHWRDQLVLGICQRLSFLPERRDRARKAGRLSQLDAEVGEQVGSVAALLSR